MDLEENFLKFETKFKLIDLQIKSTIQLVINKCDLVKISVNSSLNLEENVRLINDSRKVLLDQLRIRLENSLKILNQHSDHSFFRSCIELGQFEFGNLIYRNDFNVVKKLKNFALFNQIDLVDIHLDYLDRGKYEVQAMSFDKLVVYNKTTRELLLIKRMGEVLKKISFPMKHTCHFNVYGSKIYFGLYDIELYKFISLGVMDSNLKILKKVNVNSLSVQFYNSKLIHFSNKTQTFEVLDDNLNLIHSFSENVNYVCSPLIDCVNDRIVYLDDNDGYASLSIIEFNTRKLVNKIRINTRSSCFFRIDEEANVFLRMLDEDLNICLFCFDRNGKLLVKRNFQTLGSYHNFRPISRELMVFSDNSSNNLALI